MTYHNRILSAVFAISGAVWGASAALADPAAMPADHERDPYGCVVSYEGIKKDDKRFFYDYENGPMNYAAFSISDCQDGRADVTILLDRRTVAGYIIMQQSLDQMNDIFVEKIQRYLQQDGDVFTRDDTVSFLQALRDQPQFPISALRAAFSDFSVRLCDPAEQDVLRMAYQLEKVGKGLLHTPLLNGEELHPALLCPAGI